MGEETSKGLIWSLIWPVCATEKVPYSPVRKNKSDYYCILKLIFNELQFLSSTCNRNTGRCFAIRKLGLVNGTHII